MKKTQLIKIVQPINNSVKSFSGERLYIATKTLKGSKIEFEFSKKVDYENKPSRANQEVEVGDIIFAKMQGTRKTLLIGKSEKEYIFSSGFFVLRAGKEILNEYLFHFLNSESFLNQKDINCTGATQKALTLTGLKKIFIPLPPLPQQKQIIQKLDKLTNLIELRKESINKTEDLTKSIFIEMFGDPMLNEKGWEMKSLGEYGLLQRGKSQHRPRNAEFLFGGKYPFIQTGDVVRGNGYYIESFKQTLSDEGIKQSREFKKGTICITIAANIGDAKILTFDSYFPDSVVGISTEYPEFVATLLGFYKKKLEQQASKTAQKNINLGILNDLFVIFPPITLQNKFAEIVKKNEENIRWQKESLGKLEELYDSCMQESFSS